MSALSSTIEAYRRAGTIAVSAPQQKALKITDDEVNNKS
jgi:predicted site-specific integrase-resolvase